LVRAGVNAQYSCESPDFLIHEWGIETAVRDVPLDRAIAEVLISKLSTLDFKKLSIVLTPADPKRIDPGILCDEVSEDVELILQATEAQLTKRDYTIAHNSVAAEKTLRVTFGDYSYEATLAHVIEDRLRMKEENIAKHIRGQNRLAQYWVALDCRSLLAVPLSPQTDYEKEWRNVMPRSMTGYASSDGKPSRLPIHC
jgi:hypothetical protein